MEKMNFLTDSHAKKYILTYILPSVSIEDRGSYFTVIDNVITDILTTNTLDILRLINKIYYHPIGFHFYLSRLSVVSIYGKSTIIFPYNDKIKVDYILGWSDINWFLFPNKKPYMMKVDHDIAHADFEILKDYPQRYKFLITNDIFSELSSFLIRIEKNKV
jgi:hypothetical protein